MGDRPRLLDLFSCAGGAGVGYHRAGFEVVGVDINPQPNYPFEHYVSDAIEYAKAHGHEYDAIHGSPPCQSQTLLTKGTHRDKGVEYPDFIPQTREVLDAIGKPYVIENVVGSTLRKDLVLCGLSFGLRVFRHRIFELNWTAEQPVHLSHRGHRVAGWRHGVKYDGDMVAVYGHGGGKGSLLEWQDAMDIHWTSVRKEIAEAIPPAYTEFIGKQLMERI